MMIVIDKKIDIKLLSNDIKNKRHKNIINGNFLDGIRMNFRYKKLEIKTCCLKWDFLVVFSVSLWILMSRN